MKMTQAILVMDFSDHQREQNVLPIVFMIQDDGDPVGAIQITLMYSGELNALSVGHNQSRSQVKS